jgi:hypothetical protein
MRAEKKILDLFELIFIEGRSFNQHIAGRFSLADLKFLFRKINLLYQKIQAYVF